MDALENPVRDYAWGSTTAIQHLLGLPVDGVKVAELWVGGHPDAPSIVGAHRTPLDRFVSDRPDDVLGPLVRSRFGDRLPFLLKVLAADSPLSLQVHPDAAQARKGFDSEERAGVPRGSSRRSYKDPHHKPEMIFALSRFEALCGFRAPDATLAVLDGLQAPGLALLRRRLAHRDPTQALRSSFTALIEAGHDAVELVDAVALACARRLADGSPHAREDATVVELALRYPGDPGVVLSLLLHRVTLLPGQALFLPAGNVHAYLRGTGVELMACSDNVLRGGLTPKHVDVPGLLDVVDFAPVSVPYVRPDVMDGTLSWRPEATEFELHRVGVDDTPRVVPGSGPRLVLVVEGDVWLTGKAREMSLSRGCAAILEAADGDVVIRGAGTAFVAAVPQPRS